MIPSTTIGLVVGLVALRPWLATSRMPSIVADAYISVLVGNARCTSTWQGLTRTLFVLYSYTATFNMFVFLTGATNPLIEIVFGPLLDWFPE